MVKLVDAFTKVIGRAPTMKELDDMHELQKDREKFQELQRRVTVKKIERAQKEAGVKKQRRRHPVPLRTPKNAKIINRMLLLEMNIYQISWCMELTEKAVRNYIKDHKLPREIK